MIGRTIVACALALGAASAALAFDLQGFKQIKFGADAASVGSSGYACKQTSSFRLECSGEDTLFGMPSTVRAFFRDGKVSEIRVMAMDSKPVDLVAAYTKALGKPKTFKERNWSQEEAQVFYWVSKEGTSISTFKAASTERPFRNPDTGQERHFASADYLDREATTALIERAKKAARQKRDF